MEQKGVRAGVIGGKSVTMPQVSKNPAGWELPPVLGNEFEDLSKERA